MKDIEIVPIEQHKCSICERHYLIKNDALNCWVNCSNTNMVKEVTIAFPKYMKVNDHTYLEICDLHPYLYEVNYACMAGNWGVDVVYEKGEFIIKANMREHLDGEVLTPVTKEEYLKGTL